MRIKSLPILLVSLLFAGTATAKICKTVGPDGSVTYTDVPGADASCGKAEEPAPQPKAAGPAPVTGAGAKPVVRSDKTQQSAPASSGTAAVPSVETAVIGILGLEDLVQRSYDLCIGVLPGSAARYGNAADGWRDRNVAATTKMRRALMQTFNGAQQKVMSEGVKARNQKQLESVIASPKASQIKWCEQTAGEIDNRAFDVKDSLVAPLAIF
jgi:hypothetical protein